MSRILTKSCEMIAAVSKSGGLGKNGALPWRCPSDMAYFRKLTRESRAMTRNAVIMGRRTWESLKSPLSDRLNVVITRNYRDQQYTAPNLAAFPSLLEAHIWLDEQVDIDNRYVIGGATLYQEAIQQNWCSKLHLTTIDGDYDCDVFFPEIPEYYVVDKTQPLDEGVHVTTYNNRYGKHYEEQYLQKMRQLIHQPSVNGRNGAVFTDFQWSYQMDLADGLPLFSTRKAFWKGIAKELLFFIRGDTNSKHLESDGIGIWKGNTSSEFLSSRGLHYKEGDMGPMYGWVWRHYGARYVGMDHDYTKQGHDQLRDVLDKLINDPNNRRILMTAYDPTKVQESVLAPCHSIVNHFYVRKDPKTQLKYLDMFTYQRSADMFLGVYFNIPSDATLQTIIAQAVGMIPGRMYIQFGNCHIYDNHREPLIKQLERTPPDMLPQLKITSVAPEEITTDNALQWIESLTYDDFDVQGYKPQGHIKADMVA